MILGLCSFTAFTNFSPCHRHTEVYDPEPCPFEHHRHEVLADVVQVTFDGTDHDLAACPHPRLGQQRLHSITTALFIA